MSNFVCVCVCVCVCGWVGGYRLRKTGGDQSSFPFSTL